jgi:8-oxo-dGTP pyrophosphatase MutT (NUDIX family)
VERDVGDEPVDHPVAAPAVGEPLGPPDVVRGGPQLIPRPDEWRPGADAPWADLDDSARRPTSEQIRTALARPAGTAQAVRYGPPPQVGVPPVDRRSSAVLAAMYDVGGEPHVLLTRRSWDLRSHRGEVSFPGGAVEPDDADMVATALREAREEVGLDPAGIEILGELSHLQTFSSNARIVPIVAMLPSAPALVPDPREVAEIREVALAELLDEGVYREELWTRGGEERPIWFFELEGDTVWGATAALLRELLCRITGTGTGPRVDRPQDA